MRRWEQDLFEHCWLEDLDALPRNSDADSMINGESTYLDETMNRFLQALEHRTSPRRRIGRRVWWPRLHGQDRQMEGAVNAALARFDAQ